MRMCYHTWTPGAYGVGVSDLQNEIKLNSRASLSHDIYCDNIVMLINALLID